MRLEGFVKQVDNERVVSAIREAEARCRGEIRVHVTSQAVEDAERAAIAQFEKLGMTATKERNGVLIFVAVKSQRFAVIGDSGIHEKCGPGFWNEIARAMETDFRAGRFTEGLVKGIRAAGDALATHFPRVEGAHDVDELSNEVSED
jgi:uncharacterized membrane protein